MEISAQVYPHSTSIARVLAGDDPLAGFGSWSDTEIDEAVREVKREMDEDFKFDFMSPSSS